MNSIIKLGPGKSGGPLGIPSEGNDLAKLSTQMRSMRFPAGAIERLSGGGKEGTEEVGTEIAANVKCLINMPVKLNPRKYEIIISYNPELLRYGAVSCPSMLIPEDGADIFLGFQAYKKIDLAQLDYVFELFMID